MNSLVSFVFGGSRRYLHRVLRRGDRDDEMYSVGVASGKEGSLFNFSKD